MDNAHCSVLGGIEEEAPIIKVTAQNNYIRTPALLPWSISEFIRNKYNKRDTTGFVDGQVSSLKKSDIVKEGKSTYYKGIYHKKK